MCTSYIYMGTHIYIYLVYICTFYLLLLYNKSVYISGPEEIRVQYILLLNIFSPFFLLSLNGDE